jgi:hypothetical protein
MIITKGFGKTPITKGLGHLTLIKKILREVLRLCSKFTKTLELKSKWKKIY